MSRIHLLYLVKMGLVERMVKMGLVERMVKMGFSEQRRPRQKRDGKKVHKKKIKNKEIIKIKQRNNKEIKLIIFQEIYK